MPAPNIPTTAHFELSIDGEKILSTVALTAFEIEAQNTNPFRVRPSARPTAQKKTPKSGQSLLAHELTHVVQQCAGASRISFRVRSEAPRLSGLNRLRTGSGTRHLITAFGSNGRAIAGFTAKPVAAKEDVLQQEWSLTYEAIQRVL